MNKKKKVSVIIPAYNEETVIENTLTNLNHNWIKEIIVVNDGSTDNTLAQIKQFKEKKHEDKDQNKNKFIKIINLTVNSGKGNAVKMGLQQVSGEIIVLIDADLGDSVREIEKLVQPVLKGKSEITIAVLPIKGGGIGLVRKMADWGLNLITGQSMQAPLSGQRVFIKDVIEQMFPLAPGFGLEIGIDIDILRKGFNYKEIYCNLQHNHTGHTVNGYLHRWQQFREIVQVLWLKRNSKFKRNS